MSLYTHTGSSLLQLPGIHTALVTPLYKGKIDYAALEVLIIRQVQAQVSCITLFGTTGEGATMTGQERLEALQFARSRIPSSIALFSGCGTWSTQETIAQAHFAQEAGCDGLQIVTPSYNKPSQEGLFRHFQAIHDATSCTIFLYNVPSRTASSIELDTLSRLFALERICGIKEASGNISLLIDIIALAREQKRPITVLCGDDVFALAAIALGAHGVMSVASNLFPRTLSLLVSHALNGDYTTAQHIHYQLRTFFQACFYESNPAPIKQMLARYKLLHNELRLPLVPVSHSVSEKINQILDSEMLRPLLIQEGLLAAS